MSVEVGRPAPMRCANHPDTETQLRCSRCGKPICVRCVIQTPVGGRCKQCAGLRKPPMFQVGPLRFARAAMYGLVAALLGGLLWAQVGRGPGMMVSALLLLLVGYLVGEGVSRGADRRVSRGLMVLAVVLTFVAALAGQVITVMMRLPDAVPLSARLEIAAGLGVAAVTGNLTGLLFLVLAAAVAASRVR